MQVRLWGGVAACIMAAVISAIAERRRARRTDLDRVGLVPWLSVQLFALLTALILASIALNA